MLVHVKKRWDKCPRNELISTSPNDKRNKLRNGAKRKASFDAYVWQFVGGKPKINLPKTAKDVPTRTVESDLLSKDLKKRGMSFVGSTMIYAYMQAIGMVNDHTLDCFKSSAS